MKKLLSVLAFLGLSLTISSASAVDVVIPKSGIDLNASTLTIKFAPVSSGHKDYDSDADWPTRMKCLGSNATTVTKTFEGLLDKVDSASLGGASNGSTSVAGNLSVMNHALSATSTDCFREAGDYTIEFKLVDRAGNETIKSYRVRVRPGDPATDGSYIGKMCDTGVPECYANNQDAYVATVYLRDKFGNPVTQLNGEDADVHPATSFNLFPDANKSGYVKLSDGLRISNDNSTFEPLSKYFGGVEKLSLSLGTNASETFYLRSLVPTITQFGRFLAKLEGFPLNMNVSTYGITDKGDIDMGETVHLIATEGSSTGTIFKHPFEITPEQENSGNFLSWNNPELMEFPLKNTGGDTTSITENSVDSPRGYLLGTNSQIDYATIEVALDGTAKTEEKDVDGEPVEFFVENSFEDLADTGDGPLEAPYSKPVINSQEILSRYLLVNPKDGGHFEDEEVPIGIATEVQYIIDDNGVMAKVAYPAGGASIDKDDNGGFDPEGEPDIIGYGDDLKLKFVGVDIEGGVQGDISEMYIQQGANDNALLVGNVTVKDLRETITENARRLARGAENATSSDVDIDENKDWEDHFDSSDILVVNVGDVTIGSGVSRAPEGKNTLVIINGNLFVEGSFSYANAEDSFGVILLNDAADSSEAPDSGNIYIDPNVSKFVGSYFADGSLISGHPGYVYGSGLLEENLLNQLLLEGALFTRNTIGGAVLRDNDTFFTPWGDALSTEEAKRYDLHFIRRYTPGGGTCTPGATAGECDTNSNAFVIRPDRKATEFTPPGFEEAARISR